MTRVAFLLCTLLAPLLSCSALAAPTAPATSFTDLHGTRCHTLDTTAIGGSRLCPGVAGYALVVYDADDRSSVDIVTPKNALYPLAYWDVVTAGYASVGQKAEWLLEKRKGKPVPTALLVRLTRLDTQRPGEVIAAARIFRDGACVVFRGDLTDPAVEPAARKAAVDPASRCLAPLGSD